MMKDFFQQILDNPSYWLFFKAMIAVLVVLAIFFVIRKSIKRYVHDNKMRYTAIKLSSLAMYLVILLVFFIAYSNKLQGLSVFLGVAGAGIAFAFQEVIGSFAGWLAIMFSDFYKTGDRVQLGGIKGDVIDIGILRTTIMEMGEWITADAYNGRIVKIANSFVFKEPVFNYSSDFPFLWDEIKLPIRYGSDYKQAREIINQVANGLLSDFSQQAADKWKEMVQKYLIEDANPYPMVTMIATDNWIEFTLRYVVDFKKRRVIKDQLFTQLIEEIEKTEGKVQMASATYDIVSLPPIQVKVN